MDFETIGLVLMLMATFVSLLGACAKIERLQEEVRNWERRHQDFVSETTERARK